MTLIDNAKASREAANNLQLLSTDDKNQALKAIKDELINAKDEILAANKIDLQLASEQVKNGAMSYSMYKRLDLTSSSDKFENIIQGIQDIINLEDPAGKITLSRKLDDDLELYKVTCPIGVLLCIFEARPEVVVNITALALKSGNAAILKGGKESKNTASVIGLAIQRALRTGSKVPENAIQLVESREEVSLLLKQDQYIDLVIPRGSNELVRSIKANTSIPVMGHADGICSTYIDVDADIEKTIKVIVDAKTSYPAACNSLEQILVHVDVVQKIGIPLAKALLEFGVQLQCENHVYSILSTASETASYKDKISLASDEDAHTEFLDLIVYVKSVANVQEAVSWINSHGSKHTDAIMTENEQIAFFFLRGVDAAGVYWNASTRFSDGFRYGFGAEVGVSTNKTHARGPVGLDGLVIYKYWLKGKGNQAFCTVDYGFGKKPFLHQDF